MATTSLDDEREQRISNEIIVDAYNGQEERMGWYAYLEDHLNMPFQAEWDGENVEVVAMSDDEECQEEMKVDVCYTEGQNQDVFPVSLSEIDPVDVDEDTTEAIADWKYWVERGYDFSEGEDDEFF